MCNPKPLVPDINIHAKFEENRSKILKLEIGNEALTDGRTLKRFGLYNIIPSPFCVAGYNNT